MLIGVNKLSRYKEFNCVLMRVSGCNNHYEFVLRVVAKAKSVTNNLPILSVLVAGFICYDPLYFAIYLIYSFLLQNKLLEILF
jgi:hypothetical protein